MAAPSLDADMDSVRHGSCGAFALFRVGVYLVLGEVTGAEGRD